VPEGAFGVGDAFVLEVDADAAVAGMKTMVTSDSRWSVPADIQVNTRRSGRSITT